MPNGFLGQNLQKKSLKQKKVSFTIEFYIFKIDVKFQVKLPILNFGLNETQKGISSRK